MGTILIFLQNSLLPGFAALSVVAASLGFGLALRKIAGKKDVAPNIFELPLAMVLGMAFFAYLADLVYMAQVVSMRVFFIFLIVFGLCCVFLFFRYFKTFFSCTNSLWANHYTKFDYVYMFCGWFVIFLFCVGLYIRNVTPVSDNDSLVHYALLSKMIAGGVPFDQMLFLRNMPITDLNRLIPMLYAAAYSIMGTGASHLMNFFFIITILLLIHFFCVYHAKVIDLFNPLAVLTTLTIREIIYTGASAKVDYGVAMLVLSAILAVATYRDRALWVLALFFGFAICSRTSAIAMVLVIAFIFCIVVIWDEYKKSLNVKAVLPSVKNIFVVGIGTLMVIIPAHFVQYVVYGNPLFPFYNGIFGHYAHYYDRVVFNSLKYKVQGFSAPLIIYVQLLFKQYKDFLPGFSQFGLGLSPFFSFAPFSIVKKRENIIVYAFFILGYIVWVNLSSHTHRSLLGVAFAGVILIVTVINSFKKIKIFYITLCVAVLWSAVVVIDDVAAGQIYHRTNSHFYFLGIMDKNTFYQKDIKRLNPGYFSPNIDAILDIKKIVGDNIITCVNIYPQLYPDFIKVFRFDLPEKDMRTSLDDKNIDESDRQIFTGILSNEYIGQQYRDIEAAFWPAYGEIQFPNKRKEMWKIIRQFQDAQFHIRDAVVKDPQKIVNIMYFCRSRFLVTHRSDTFLQFSSVPSLKLIWQSPEIDLFELVES